jgi:hypothetical protein
MYSQVITGRKARRSKEFMMRTEGRSIFDTKLITDLWRRSGALHMLYILISC